LRRPIKKDATKKRTSDLRSGLAKVAARTQRLIGAKWGRQMRKRPLAVEETVDSADPGARLRDQDAEFCRRMLAAIERAESSSRNVGAFATAAAVRYFGIR
jgi:hypothetical protein